MISFGSSKKTTNTSQQSQTEPWGPAIPYLTRFLQDLDMGRSTLGPSGDQLDAFGRLKENAAAGKRTSPGWPQTHSVPRRARRWSTLPMVT